jgi:hypothetical protein
MPSHHFSMLDHRAWKNIITYLRISSARSKPKSNIFYKQLSLEERTMIQTQLSMGFKSGRITQELGRSASTLSLGNAASMRTPTACCASTCPGVVT